jgi:two-component system OmpR family response regulator
MDIRILVVDDDSGILNLLCGYLADFNMQADCASDGATMRHLLRTGRYDLLVLDLMLPDTDGLALCREIRATSNLPILILTARNTPADRVLGLELGADDYIVKPFDPRELVARIHSILRRAGTGPGKVAEAQDIQFDRWRLDRILRQLTSPEGLVIPLSNAEFRLLWAFIEHPRQVLSRDRLMDIARGRGMEAFDRSIDLLVSRLRQKLADDPREPRLIKTVRGEGYLLDTRVSW